MVTFGRLWRGFLGIVDSKPRRSGVIIALASGGRYVVQLADGGAVVARAGGSYATNDRVFIVGDVIESKAPALASVVIDV